jgi:putative ABC transport system permease protein
MAPRRMFFRLLWQLLRGNRGRLAVALIAIISGAAAVSALLNMEFDVHRKFAQEFRGLGANLLISAQPAPGSTDRPLLDSAAVEAAASVQAPAGTVVAPFVYIVARASSATSAATNSSSPSHPRSVVLAGTWLDLAPQLSPWWALNRNAIPARNDQTHCIAGATAAKLLNVTQGSELHLEYGASAAPGEPQTRQLKCAISQVISTGGEEDTQIFASLAAVQTLANLGDRIELMKLRVPGAPDQIKAFADRIPNAMPGIQASPIHEIPATEGALLHRISLLVFSMSTLLLILTAICVLGTMAALAAERRTDVGLMKALGGSIQRIVSLFLAELTVLGVAGGILGYIAGIGLTFWIGEKVFGVRVSPRPEVFLITILLMLVVTLVGVIPLRSLGRVKPAVILRGE